MKILLAPLIFVFVVTFVGVFLVACFVVWLGWQLLVFLVAGVVLGVDAIIERIRA